MRFEIEGTPVAEQRHRTVTRNGKTIRYLPKKTKDYQKKIQTKFKQEMERAKQELPLFKKGEEVELIVYAGKRIPKSYTKKQTEEILKNGRKPATKPDVDNYAKIVMDALNGLAYKDDNQVSTILVKKMYVQPDTPEKLMISIERDLPPQIIDKINKGE